MRRARSEAPSPLVGPNGRTWALALALLVAPLVACSPEGAAENDTIRVVFSTNLTVPDELDQLHVLVQRDTDPPALNAYYSLDATAADAGALVTLPDTLLLHNLQPMSDTGHYDESSHISIFVEGLRGGEPHILRRANVNSRTDRPRLLHMPLCRACLDDTRCTCEGEACKTCAALGECADALIFAESLELDDGTASLESTECL